MLLRYFDDFQIDEADLEAELAALGDELDLGETDTNYLDEALSAPGVPTSKPTSSKVNIQITQIWLEFKKLSIENLYFSQFLIFLMKMIYFSTFSVFSYKYKFFINFIKNNELL